MEAALRSVTRFTADPCSLSALCPRASACQRVGASCLSRGQSRRFTAKARPRGALAGDRLLLPGAIQHRPRRPALFAVALRARDPREHQDARPDAGDSERDQPRVRLVDAEQGPDQRPCPREFPLGRSARYAVHTDGAAWSAKVPVSAAPRPALPAANRRRRALALPRIGVASPAIRAAGARSRFPSCASARSRSAARRSEGSRRASARGSARSGRTGSSAWGCSRVSARSSTTQGGNCAYRVGGLRRTARTTSRSGAATAYCRSPSAPPARGSGPTSTPAAPRSSPFPPASAYRFSTCHVSSAEDELRRTSSRFAPPVWPASSALRVGRGKDRPFTSSTCSRLRTSERRSSGDTLSRSTCPTAGSSWRAG
jgi:hypothetical protein